jgi:8-amino-7-oxononanoate synthase
MKKLPFYDRIRRQLDEKKAAGLLRRTAPFDERGGIDLATNSYLGLHLQPSIGREAQELCASDMAGNLASRIIASRTPLFDELEAELAAWKHAEAALVFNSGYAANLGILQAIATRGTEVFSDRLNHASLVDGIRLADCRMVRYAHADLDDLARRLKASSAPEKIIVTDTVFSMDGDRAPLAEICQLAHEHDAVVMVDEAHATGVLGASLGGLVEELHLEDAIDIYVGTLSKSIGGMGGFFAGSELMREFLVNHCRSLIFSTALPHSQLAWNLAAVRHIRRHPEMGPALLDKAERFRTRLQQAGYDTLNSTTQIVPCLLGEESAALQLSAFLRQRGIIAPAIRPPTVPAGTARLRLSIHLGLSEEQMEQVIGCLSEWRKSEKV